MSWTHAYLIAFYRTMSWLFILPLLCVLCIGIHAACQPCKCASVMLAPQECGVRPRLLPLPSRWLPLLPLTLHSLLG